MRSFTKEKADEVLKNQIDPKTLAHHYPEYKEAVLKEFSVITKESTAEEIAAIITSYKSKARLAMDKIHQSGNNQKTLNAFLPDIIKARIAIDILQQSYLVAQSGKTSGKIRFNLWDGFILQKLLFKGSFERKPVSLFWFKIFWTFITNKKILIPLVNKKGIYCFYSKALIKDLAALIGKTKCLEIGAGDGTLTTFLRERGVDCTATDDYSWGQYIQYPSFVERAEAREALNKYKPETVICSWPPPGNTFEKSVFTMDFVKTYIVIGSRNPLFTGDHNAYQKQDDFTIEYDYRMSARVLPQSVDNAVTIFRRKTDERIPG